MKLISITTDPSFQSKKANLNKKIARKLAGFSKNTANTQSQNVSVPYIQPVIQRTSMAISALAAAPIAFTQALQANWFKLGKDEEGNQCLPDIFQKAAGVNIIKGDDVLVTAPTGTGKTAIAHFAINKNLEQGKRTLYTTPLKALSNEKFKTFQQIYGEDNVGIMTGDVKINTEAPIVILTTEIYRNMVFKDYMTGEQNSSGLKNVNTVIFDELHYLGDVDRGGIWEQSLMFTPPNMQILSLSATIGNNKNITDWMARIKGISSQYVTFDKQKDINSEDSTLVTNGIPGTGNVKTVLIEVPKENRHVPLEFILHQGEVSGRRISSKLSKAEKRKAQKHQNDSAAAISARPSRSTYSKLVDELCEADRLPAILFIFSKSNSLRVLDELKSNCECLNNHEEMHEIYETIKRYEMEGKYLGESIDTEALYRGYAIHNAGMLPVQKELIEELFQRKLVKVVIATETLAAGINMPARTTVISSIRKPSDHPDGEDGMRMLSPNDFHQMAGRAGRRGIDKIGYCYAIGCNSKQNSVIKDLIAAGSNKLKSSFIPDYSFLASYYDITQNDGKLKEMMSKSLQVYDVNLEAAKKKEAKLFKKIEEKKELLKAMSFLNEDNTLTKKGELLKHLNGYVQLPIIEFLSNDTLLDLSPVQLAGFIGLLANMETIKTSGNEETESRDNANLEIHDKMLKTEIRYLRDYLKEYSAITGEEVELDTDTAQNIYRFAELNSKPGSNSIMNWKYMYDFDNQSEIEYEGQLFRQITTTLDLMKQLYSIVDREFAGRAEFAPQAMRLKTNLFEAMNLINQPPVKI